MTRRSGGCSLLGTCLCGRRRQRSRAHSGHFGSPEARAFPLTSGFRPSDCARRSSVPRQRALFAMGPQRPRPVEVLTRLTAQAALSQTEERTIFWAGRRNRKQSDRAAPV